MPVASRGFKFRQLRPLSIVSHERCPMRGQISFARLLGLLMASVQQLVEFVDRLRRLRSAVDFVHSCYGRLRATR